MYKSVFTGYDFRALGVRVDLGFLGIKKVIKNGIVSIPHKASKCHPLTQAQKDANRVGSGQRIAVENTIGGIKRYGIVSSTNRMRTDSKFDAAMETCSNLWNYKKNFSTV
jgi:hypothetical protein